MEKMSLDEQKKVLIDMLDYLHKICVSNNINYSLIAGSLIGAVRHKGIIPWDDDIDVILTFEEYNKLITYFSKNNDNERYKLFTYTNNDTYYYPFAKLIDTHTYVNEYGCDDIKDYGVYIDIFSFNNAPKNKILLKLHYGLINILMKMIQSSCYNTVSKEKNFYLLRKFKNKVCHLIGHKILIKMYIKISTIYNSNPNSPYYISTWPIYGLKKEVHLKENMDEYKIVKFDKIKAMIFANYDKILRETFGDYMTPPPIEEQVTHHSMDCFWK